MKRVSSIILVFIFFINSTLSIGAQNISSTTKLDTSSSLIKSNKADYSIRIPDSWSSYIVAYIENPAATKEKILEKINFYYEPQNNINKPIFLMSIYIFAKKDWSDMNTQKKLLETDDYVFSTTTASTNPFTNKTDKTLYHRFLLEVSSADFLKNMIIIPKNFDSRNSYTITVNNKKLKNKVVYKENNIVYLPIRETCEALGYKISWNARMASIVIEKDGFRASLQTSSDYKSSPYNIMIINNISYISSMFFIKSLKASVEVDEYSNVIINK